MNALTLCSRKYKGCSEEGKTHIKIPLKALKQQGLFLVSIQRRELGDDRSGRALNGNLIWDCIGPILRFPLLRSLEEWCSCKSLQALQKVQHGIALISCKSVLPNVYNNNEDYSSLGLYWIWHIRNVLIFLELVSLHITTETQGLSSWEHELFLGGINIKTGDLEIVLISYSLKQVCFRVVRWIFVLN